MTIVRPSKSAREAKKATMPGQSWVLQSNILISVERQGGSAVLCNVFRPPPQVWEHSPSLHSLHSHVMWFNSMLSVSVQSVRFLYLHLRELLIRITSFLQSVESGKRKRVPIFLSSSYFKTSPPPMNSLVWSMIFIF